jgi:hypothetical protein
MPLSYIHPDDIRTEEGDIPHYCDKHVQDVPKEFYSPKIKGPVEFSGA